MMPYGGAVLAMIVSLKNNALRRRKPYEKIKENQEKYVFKHKDLRFKQPTKEELEAFREKHHKELAFEKRRNTVISIVVIILFAVGSVFFIQYVHQKIVEERALTALKIEERKRLQDKKKLFYVNDGFKWLNKKHYKNARFQFLEAIKIDPKDFNARYGYVYTLVCECIETGYECQNAWELLYNLNKEFGNKPEVKTLYELYVDPK